MATYGRNRQSIADIEQKLNDIFNNHPKSQLNHAGDPVIPGDALVDVFRGFSDVYNGVELMTNEEMDMLKALLATNPGLEVTPQILLQFIAARSKHSPHDSPEDSPYESDASVPSQDRGRTRDCQWEDENGRSSSSDSASKSFLRSSNSRPPSRGPQTPVSAGGQSPFDVSKRQRSTPLGNNAPSSWNKRPTPAHRRKSDAGLYASDSEHNGAPSSFRGSRTSSRSRAPSNPASPRSTSQPDLGSFSPASPSSRSHSRSRSHPQPQFLPMGFAGSSSVYGSPGSPGFHGPPSPTDLDFEDSFSKSISSLPMPVRHSCDSDTDSDDAGDDSTLGLVLDRSTTSSTVSLAPQDRLDALQRTNAEMGKKLMEAERTLQKRLSEHEMELEEMQSRLEESKSELSATKREEKELRAKERQNSTQITALESEIAKLQKSLDNARASYQSLQKQYLEQCAESERYRNTLRLRDEEIKDFKDSAALQQIETQKWAREREACEDRLSHLETELTVAQQANVLLDEQKVEIVMLRETIDRMRFDMDEMRSNASAAADSHNKSGSSGIASVVGSMSKSLGAELAGKMTQWGLGMEAESPDTDADADARTALENGLRSGLAQVEGEGEQDEGEVTEGEDVVQTIITRKKRKVAGRANRIQTHTFEELKEYSDAYTQHEPRDFTSAATVQTDPEPKALTSSLSVQTETVPQAPLPAPKAECEVQTDEPAEEDTEAEHSADEAMASSSSTLIPSTPKLTHEHLHPDSPPAYEQDEDEWRQVADALKKWHRGAQVPLRGAPAGLSDDALDGWRAFQDEVGVGCVVLEKIVEKSLKVGPRSPMSAHPGAATGDQRPTSGRGRFYNIYNTYVYGKGDGPSSASFTPAVHALMCAGASAVMILLMTPYMIPHYSVPGAPTYYDRAAWVGFNSMQAVGEGFAVDGTNAVWSFLGTIGGGAARIVRGWPT